MLPAQVEKEGLRRLGGLSEDLDDAEAVPPGPSAHSTDAQDFADEQELAEDHAAAWVKPHAAMWVLGARAHGAASRPLLWRAAAAIMAQAHQACVRGPMRTRCCACMPAQACAPGGPLHAAPHGSTSRPCACHGWWHDGRGGGLR